MSQRPFGTPSTSAGLNAFVDRVAVLTGLSSVFARQVVTRACQRAGIDPAQLAPTNLAHVLPSLEEGMALYLNGSELETRIAMIRKLAA